MHNPIIAELKGIAKFLKSQDEEAAPVDTGIEAPEEKDPAEEMQENIKANFDKYQESFEKMFPATQMAVTNIEYRGDVTKDKIRVLVDFQTSLLNFDALEILADKEVGIEALETGTFRVFNIYLPLEKNKKGSGV